LAIFWDVIGYPGKVSLSNSCAMYGFAQSLAGGNGSVLSMRMQVILDTSLSRVGRTPEMGGEGRIWSMRSGFPLH